MLCTIAFAALAGLIGAGRSLPGDRYTLLELHAAIGRSIDGPMTLLGNATEGPVLAGIGVLVAVSLFVMRRRVDAWDFIACTAVVWIVNPGLKALVDRPRPHLWPAPEAVSSLSFPSGHASGTAALVGALTLFVFGPEHRRLAAATGAAFLAAVGFSRIAVGVHYPSDILGGWLWATAWITFVWWTRLHRDNRSPPHRAPDQPPSLIQRFR